MAYPNGQSMLSLAEYKTLTGTTSTAYDAFLNAQIPAVERAIETYCRRRFLSYTWKEWFSVDRQVITSNWPITQVLLIGVPYAAFQINDTTNNYSFSITQETSNNSNVVGKFSVVDQSALTSTDYLFSTYTNVGSLKTAVESNVAGVTFEYQTLPTTVNMANVSSQTLRQTNGKTIYFGSNYFDQTTSNPIGDIWRISDNSDRILLNPNFLNTSRVFSNGYDYYSTGYNGIDPNNQVALDGYSPDDMLVVYTAGYAPSDIPADLKQIIANITRDIASVYDMDASMIPKNIYRSESLGDYNYSLDPNSSLGNLISIKYAAALDWYKKKNI